MHARVRGVLAEPPGRFPAGTPYAADDPELLLWILAMLVDSALAGLRALRRARCRAPSATRYWQDYRVIGRLFGLRRRRHAGDDGRTSRRYMRDMVDGGDLP